MRIRNSTFLNHLNDDKHTPCDNSDPYGFLNHLNDDKQQHQTIVDGQLFLNHLNDDKLSHLECGW